MITISLSSNFKSTVFNGETTFLGWLYGIYLDKIPEYKNFKFYKINIAFSDFIKEEYVITGGRKMYFVTFRYELNEYFKLNDNQRKKEVNDLYYKYLKLLFEHLKLPIEPLTEVYHKIIEDNYEKLLICIKSTPSKDKSLEANVVILPDLKHFSYFLQIQDTATREVLHKILLFNGRQGWFLNDVINKIKWEKKERIFIHNKFNKPVYGYSLVDKTLEIIDTNALEMYIVV